MYVGQPLFKYIKRAELKERSAYICNKMKKYSSTVDHSTLTPAHSAVYAFCAATSSFFNIVHKKEKYNFLKHMTTELAYAVPRIFSLCKLSKYGKESSLQHTLMLFSEEAEISPVEETAILHFFANYYEINIFVATKVNDIFVYDYIPPTHLYEQRCAVCLLKRNGGYTVMPSLTTDNDGYIFNPLVYQDTKDTILRYQRRKKNSLRKYYTYKMPELVALSEKYNVSLVCRGKKKTKKALYNELSELV